MDKSKNLIALAVGAALGSLSSVAGGAGFALMEQNASGLGNAYAGQAATAEDASTIYFNPAGMTRLPGRQVVGALHAIRPKAEFGNAGTVPAPFQALGTNGGDAGDWALVPNAYLSWQLNPHWFVGVGLNAPFGLKTEYDANWMGRFHAVKSELKTYNVNPSVAWKLNDQVSFGAGVSFQRADATLSSIVNYAGAAFLGAFNATIAGGGGVAAANAAGAAAAGAVAAQGRGQGLVEFEADDDSWGWNVGALFTLGSNTRIGIHYRSSIEYDLTGGVVFANVPVLGGALGAGLAAQFANGPVFASVELPATASWSIFHQLNPRWDLLADITWTEWSSIKSLDIFRGNGVLLSRTTLDWKDVWRFSVGANYHYSNQWTLRLGAAFDQSPSNDAFRTPRIPDQDRTWLSIGAQFRASKQLAIDVGYTYIFVKDPNINLCGPATAATVDCAGKNRLAGSYDSNVNILSAQLRYAF